MSRYSPSRHYLAAGLAALVLAAVTGWISFRWAPSLVPSLMFGIAGAGAIFLYFRPIIEIHPHHLRVGSSILPWADIQAVDRTGWVSPLVVLLTLMDGSRRLLIYPGDLDGSHSLLRQVRRSAREALIDGIPYQEFWGEVPSRESLERMPTPVSARQASSVRYPLLREEDEAEVERLYQRLKSVGNLDTRDEN
ncbi:MAG: hypothetical protein U0Q16_35410 [Bryobacteraceae bacterium]